MGYSHVMALPVLCKAVGCVGRGKDGCQLRPHLGEEPSPAIQPIPPVAQPPRERVLWTVPLEARAEVAHEGPTPSRAGVPGAPASLPSRGRGRSGARRGPGATSWRLLARSCEQGRESPTPRNSDPAPFCTVFRIDWIVWGESLSFCLTEAALLGFAVKGTELQIKYLWSLRAISCLPLHGYFLNKFFIS